MIVRYENLAKYWDEKLLKLKCNEIARAYITNILTQYSTTKYDLSTDSLTFVYSKAKQEQNFKKFQTLGDYIFWAESIFPGALTAASKEYYHSLARLSYYSCFRLINRKMDVYEFLADEFVELTEQTQSLIRELEIYDHRFLTFRI
jgi:hypothetical protein